MLPRKSGNPKFLFLRQLRWGDYALLSALLLASFIAWNWNRSAEAQKLLVEITQKGERSLYPLDEERNLVLRNNSGKKVMLIKIQNQQVWVQESNCLLQYCVQRGAIERVGQWVACLPNQVFIRIMGQAHESFSLDAEVF